MNNYFVGKKIRANKAYDHAREMEKRFKKEISFSFNHTTIYSSIPLMDKDETIYCGKPEIMFMETDTVSAIIDIGSNYHMNGPMAALNFASYKNPGGMFLKGSSAQEESLCHESFLFNVLRRFEDYYKWNRGNLNKALYTNRALYTPSIYFLKNTIINDNQICVPCDIITCAAPNKGAAMKYNIANEYDNTIALQSRIRFVLSIASLHHVDTLILGAYGCGVFRQDPYEVASIFKYEIEYIRPCKRIVFAIPTGHNYDAFAEVFSN